MLAAREANTEFPTMADIWQEKIGGLVSFVHGDNVSFSLFYIFYQGEKSKFLKHQAYSDQDR